MLVGKFKNIIILCVACAMLSSCNGNKQAIGTGVGALAGGLLGAQFGKGSGQFIAAGVGAIAGGLIGNAIGKSMDDQDKLMAERSSQQALESSPSGSSVGWKNPDSGHYGEVTPTKTYKANDGRYCREYTQTVVIGGEKQQAYGKACRQPDGKWEIVKG